MSTKKKEAVQTTTETTSQTYSQNNNTPKTTKSSSGKGRTRNFAKLVYPTKKQYETWYAEHRETVSEEGEIVTMPRYDGADGYGDAPDGWQEILAETHVGALVSPLHGFDVNPDGALKKPHYHVVLIFDGVKTQAQADEIFDKIHGVGKEEIASIRGYARYLQHLDNPEKYRYTEKPREFGGVDYDAITHLPSDDIQNVKDMIVFIRRNQITSFAKFVDICATSNEEWFNALVHTNSYFIKEYIKSYEWEMKHQYDEEGY